MPSISEILDSVSVPSLIKDQIIKNGEFDKTSKGVVYYTGGFTVVFPVNVNGHKWAFRCWHTEMGNVRKRFKIISDYINTLQSSYFCNFYYCESGLIVDGKIFPTTRMSWVDGDTINQYIIRNSQNKDILLSLAEEFLKLIDYLHSKHVAHGDLQHGNIIVTPMCEIKLVDYDSLFVPGLEGETDIITGKAEFQHPKRNQLKITSEKLDYFSELVIYLSILSIAQDPDIIQEFSIDDSLLFQASDWNDFESSAIYKRLKSLGNNSITLLIDILSNYLKEENVNNLRPFPEIWRELEIEPIVNSFVCGNVDGIAFRGLETEISWVAENVEKIDINSIELPTGQTTYKMVFIDDTDVILTVKNGLHSVVETKHIRVIDAPKIEFIIDKTKLKKANNGGNGNETAKLNWSVSNALSVTIQSEGKVLSSDKSGSNFVVQPKADTIYELIAIGLDGKTEFRSKIDVVVREPAKIEFQSDKMFTLPNVPITISWNTQGAKNIKLNGNSIGIKGRTVFTLTKDERYVLTYEDDFGEASNELLVKMLPLPIVKSILVDTPNINNSVNIKYLTPKFKGMPVVPVIESTFVNLVIPEIPTLQDCGLFVKLPESPKVKFMQKISHFLRTIFK